MLLGTDGYLIVSNLEVDTSFCNNVSSACHRPGNTDLTHGCVALCSMDLSFKEQDPLAVCCVCVCTYVYVSDACTSRQALSDLGRHCFQLSLYHVFGTGACLVSRANHQ